MAQQISQPERLRNLNASGHMLPRLCMKGQCFVSHCCVITLSNDIRRPELRDGNGVRRSQGAEAVAAIADEGRCCEEPQ